MPPPYSSLLAEAVRALGSPDDPHLDSYGHGTAYAGIIRSLAPNVNSIASKCWERD